MFNWFRRYPALKTIIVNLRSGTVFRGVLYQETGPYLMLKQTEMLSDRDSKMDPRIVSGEVLVYRRDVDFIQVVTDGGH